MGTIGLVHGVPIVSPMHGHALLHQPPLSGWVCAASVPSGAAASGTGAQRASATGPTRGGGGHVRVAGYARRRQRRSRPGHHPPTGAQRRQRGRWARDRGPRPRTISGLRRRTISGLRRRTIIGPQRGPRPRHTAGPNRRQPGLAWGWGRRRQHKRRSPRPYRPLTTWGRDLTLLIRQGGVTLALPLTLPPGIWEGALTCQMQQWRGALTLLMGACLGGGGVGLGWTLPT